ncbi:hypothetical protein GMMP15_370019 [Candidatus Magnetomoraceae bacterium gMMP-15]
MASISQIQIIEKKLSCIFFNPGGIEYPKFAYEILSEIITQIQNL